MSVTWGAVIISKPNCVQYIVFDFGESLYWNLNILRKVWIKTKSFILEVILKIVTNRCIVSKYLTEVGFQTFFATEAEDFEISDSFVFVMSDVFSELNRFADTGQVHSIFAVADVKDGVFGDSDL